MRAISAGAAALVISGMGAIVPGLAADLPSTAEPPAILSPQPTGPASAFSAGPVVGVDGVGFQAGYRYDQSFGGRALLQVLHYDNKFTATGLRFKNTIDFINGTLMADWYPFQGGFRVSAGLRFGQTKLKVRAQASDIGTFVVNGSSYATAGISSITGTAEYNPVAPVLTIGYEAQPSSALPLFLSIDAGAAYLGTAKVKLKADGPDAADPTFQSNLRAQEKAAKRELDNWPVTPVLNVSLTYLF
jgi:hypothetical protein